MDEIFAEIQNAAQVIATPNYADIAAIIVSLIAIVAATWVAYQQNKISKKQVEISEQQNRIALFEKRQEIYQLVQNYNHFIWLITKLAKEGEDLYELYILSKSNMDTVAGDIETFDRRIVASRIMDSSQKLSQAEFLFSSDIIVYTRKLRIQLQRIALHCLVAKSGNIEDIKKTLKELLETYNAEKIAEKMEEELRPTIVAQRRRKM